MKVRNPAVIFVTISLPFLGLGQAHQFSAGKKPAIVVHVFNQAGLDPQTLGDAERDAAKIFGDAGIQSTVESSSGDFSVRRPRSGEFLVRIVDRKPITATHGMLGFVAIDRTSNVRFAAVYEPAIDTVAKNFACERYHVVGAVIAHEIGHLILGPAHGRHGLMHPNWGPLQFLQIKFRALEFTPEEAGRLRTDVGRLLAAPADSSDAQTQF